MTDPANQPTRANNTLGNTATEVSPDNPLLNAWQEVLAIRQAMKNCANQKKDKFRAKNQLLPYERIERLIDPGKPFIPLCELAGYKMYDDKDGSTAGGGILAGIGFIENTRCLIIANNSAIKGGTISPIGLTKSLRLQDIAMQQKLPVITLAESGGANLNYASDLFVEGAKSFANQARLSAAGIPQITLVHGNATAGGAYQPALSDYVILVRNKSQMFLAGPPLVLAAIGEVVDEETLGGAKLHAETVGTGDFIVDNDIEAIELAKSIVKTLNWPQVFQHNEPIKPPQVSAEEILSLIPNDSKIPYDVHDVLRCLVDNSSILPFKSAYDSQTFCGFAAIGGIECGIIGNNGPITAQGAGKAAHFIQLCEQTNRPLIFLHNTTGFMVGSESEAQGVIKQGAKLIQAVANTQVPKISLVIGGSYGAGNYAMCGRGLNPDFIFAWPNSKTSVMGGDQAGKVMRIVAEQKQTKAGITPDPKVLDFLEQSTKEKIDKESTALFGSARIWDDGLIHPCASRALLIELLYTVKDAAKRQLNTNTFGIARH